MTNAYATKPSCNNKGVEEKSSYGKYPSNYDDLTGGSDTYLFCDVKGIFVPGKIVTVSASYKEDSGIYGETSFCVKSLNELADLWETFCDENDISIFSVYSFERIYLKEDALEYGDEYYMEE